MYRSVNDFLEDWKFESDGTLKLLGKLSDKSLQQKVTKAGRSLGRLAWHLALTLPEMLNRTGLAVEGPTEDAPIPKTVKEIVEAYRKSAEAVSLQVKKQWKNSDLRDEVNMYDENWKKGKVLLSLILHQTHHRAQMTVLMRQAGLEVTGIYGPAREEWKKFNMPPME
ncbi:MAG: hypothetical protein A2Y94_06055 [Caldithrix sp. RBG_13_44_9]|nr:MAG: hypothetical protein A2Y94_06055 [Caldithrix sp. RBG_13_44_9]